jgi:hypothetical protein
MSARAFLVASAIALCLAISPTSFAALERHHSSGKGAVKQHRLSRPNPSGIPAFDYRRGTSNWPFGPRFNLPYPGRPYGDPDRWGEN